MPPRLARLLAVVVAVGLVVAAFLVRGALTDDDDQVSAGPGDTTEDPDGTYRLVCDPDLGDACTSLQGVPGVEVEVRPAGEILTDDLDGIDAWLTLDPLPAVLDEARRFAGLGPATSADPLAIASSSLALLTFEQRGVECDGEWTCIATAAGSQDVGVPTLSSAAGLLTASGAFAALAGDDLSRGIGALDENGIRSRLRDVTANQGDLADQQGRIVTQRGLYAGIVTTSGLAIRREQRSSAAGLVTVPLAPEVTLGVVLVGVGSRGEAAVAALEEAVTGQTVAQALAAAGWGGEALRSDGLPDPDVIDALREELG